MLETPLTDFTVDKPDGYRGNSLILVTDRSFYLSDNNRLVFCPSNLRVSTDDGTVEIQSPEIPIRKIEPDMAIEDMLEDLIVRRPRNPYIRLSDISKAISWWIVNNAEELNWPETVEVGYTGTDGDCSVVFRRTGKRKWEPEFARDGKTRNDVLREFNRIRREMWNEDV